MVDHHRGLEGLAVPNCKGPVETRRHQVVVDERHVAQVRMMCSQLESLNEPDVDQGHDHRDDTKRSATCAKEPIEEAG